MVRNVWSIVIGLGIPFVAIVVVVPILSGIQAFVFGIPVVFFWVFLWFPLTSVCLWITWYVFDRPLYERSGGAGK
jgi:hypothetical protein